MFWLDILGNLPRLRLSEAHMKIVLFIMKQTGSKHVPPYSALKRMQQAMNQVSAAPTVRRTSEFGNTFFTNDPCATFAMASPLPLLHPLADNVCRNFQTRMLRRRWHSTRNEIHAPSRTAVRRRGGSSLIATSSPQLFAWTTKSSLLTNWRCSTTTTILSHSFGTPGTESYLAISWSLDVWCVCPLQHMRSFNGPDAGVQANGDLALDSDIPQRLAVSRLARNLQDLSEASLIPVFEGACCRRAVFMTTADLVQIRSTAQLLCHTVCVRRQQGARFIRSS